MESSRACTNCKKKTVIRDEISGNSVCVSCGIEQEFDNFQAHYSGIDGPQGIFVRVGSSGGGGDYNYKEKKLYEAQKTIEDIMSKLEFSTATSAEVKRMIETVTEGELGQGNWFPILVGACSYVVMRKNKSKRSLPIAEVASTIGCDIYELGRMIARVVEFLDLNMPEFDIVNSFEQAIQSCPSFSGISKEKVDRMVTQGRFLLQCAIKWFLTTGRRPLPVVAAVMVFVAELNNVEVGIEIVSKEVHAVVATSRRRYKELQKRLVEVAQALPWGKDVTLKNIAKNAPFVFQYMEMKSRLKPGEKKKKLESVGFNLEDMVSGCLRKEVNFEYAGDTSKKENDSQYFDVEDRNGITSPSVDDLEKLKLSQESLSRIYSQFSNGAAHVKSVSESGKDHRRKRRRGSELRECNEWWTAKSDLCKKLSLEQIGEKNVGCNALPPSFVSGVLACKRRREKITSAKLRINEIMRPPNTCSGDKEDLCVLKHLRASKKWKGTKVGDIDWEDYIIETLLLHQVKEEEIEKGHYNALLDLHVFNYVSFCDTFGH